MTTSRVIHAATAPDNTGINTGNFSQAVRVGDTVYVGGVLAIDQQAQQVVDDDFAAAARQCFTNLDAICREAGSSLADVVTMNALLTDLANLQSLNDVQAEFFGAPFPARSTFCVVGLPHGPLELTAVLHVGSGPLTT